LSIDLLVIDDQNTPPLATIANPFQKTRFQYRIGLRTG
jgi:hypothetical protein